MQSSPSGELVGGSKYMNKKEYNKPSMKVVELNNEVLMLDGSQTNQKNPDLEGLPIDDTPMRDPWD